MSIFKLAYKTKDGGDVDLPAAMNNFAAVQDLKDFARQHGYDTADWNGDHEKTLKKFFEHAALAKSDLSPEDVDLAPFQVAVRKEDGLFALDAEIFEQRFKDGVLNAVVDSNGTLVSTMNVLPKLNPGIKARLSIQNEPNNPQVYETGAGWAAPSHRGLGIYTIFRRAVLTDEGALSKLIFSQARGKGASHVNIRDGWTLINAPQFPFATALMGWPAGDGLLGRKFQLASGLMLDLPPRGVYQGRNIDFSTDEQGHLNEQAQRFLKNHNWNLYHHVWANDFDKLTKFEQTLRKALDVGADVGAPDGGEPIAEHVYHEAQIYHAWLEAIKRHSFLMNKDQVVDDNAGWDEFGSTENAALQPERNVG